MTERRRALPASVYLRRRIAVFGGLAAVVAIVVLIVVRPDPSTVGAQQSDSSARDFESEAVICAPDQLQLFARTDQVSYDPEVLPQLWMGVRNISSLECVVNVGTDRQRYVITSGSDLVWSSEDCQEGSVPYEVVLGPGSERETSSIPWDRTRSSPETCDSDRPLMPAGGASYHLKVFLGDQSSEETKQFLLY